MGNEDVDLITLQKSSEKRTLCDKYDIPIEHLSYEYITKCKNIKELERIVIILRSGEEGYYPDLNKHAEERLASVKPESIVLRKTQPVITRSTLEKDKQLELDTDIDDWMRHMRLREKDLNDGKLLSQDQTLAHPDIRKITTKPTSSKKTSQIPMTNGRIKSCDYNAWDKYDVDTELNRIDLKEEQRQSQVKRNQQKEREKMKKMSRETIVNKLTLTGTELCVMAEQEREKGNEAFKAGDYEEALQFYNSSLMIDSTINGYNNRAITYIKLHRFNDAIKDCDKVLAMDYANIKALLRRALAFEELKLNDKALADYEIVLKIEPTNKIAIAAIKKLRIPHESKKVRMKIEEDNIETNIAKIIDISNKEDEMRYEICFCDRAPTSSQYAKPLPHKKGSYCCDTPSNINNHKKKQYPKSQSIFTHFEKSPRHTGSSGVIIEELPNEYVQNIPNNSSDKISLLDTNERNINFGQGDHARENFDENINSPYEFICAWQALRDDPDLKLHAQLLRSLGPDNLESVIGNKLDGQMFSIVLRCLNLHFCDANNAMLLQNFLINLSKLKRFTIVSMFMDNTDKGALINMITFLDKEKAPLVATLCKTYNIKMT